MNIFCLHNNTGSRYYRIVPQLKWMQARGHKVILETIDCSNIEQYLDWADVLILQMVLSKEIVDLARSKNKKIVFECDDLLHNVPKTHYGYKDTRGIKNKIKWFGRLFHLLKNCDGFISTTQTLDKLYGRWAKKSLVFPNYCDLTHWLKEEKENQSDYIRLLWAGSTSHTGDLQMLKPVINKILLKYPQVKFLYIGMGGINTDNLYAKFIYGEDFFSELPDNRESLLSVHASVWPYVLSGLMADIAIAPLEKNYFNTFKSQCKYLEYGINKIPAVYSRHHYTDVKEGNTGLLADTLDEWQEKISLLIENKGLRKLMGKEAQADIISNHFTENYLHIWQEFVENL
jgi:glycosyltransferase involved in cell wall biosynthesis